MLTVADDSTLRESERNGLCQRPVNNTHQSRQQLQKRLSPGPATFLLRKTVMHENDKKIFAATQSKGKTEAS